MQVLKKLFLWGAVGFLTTAFLDPLMYSMLDQPIPWFRDVIMFGGGVACLYLLVKFRNEL